MIDKEESFIVEEPELSRLTNTISNIIDFNGDLFENPFKIDLKFCAYIRGGIVVKVINDVCYNLNIAKWNIMVMVKNKGKLVPRFYQVPSYKDFSQLSDEIVGEILHITVNDFILVFSESLDWYILDEFDSWLGLLAFKDNERASSFLNEYCKHECLFNFEYAIDDVLNCDLNHLNQLQKDNLRESLYKSYGDCDFTKYLKDKSILEEWRKDGLY